MFLLKSKSVNLGREVYPERCTELAEVRDEGSPSIG
jgi:hypothetical protein